MNTQKENEHFDKGVQNLKLIAKLFGGWNIEPDEKTIRSRFAWLRLKEKRLNFFATAACNGEGLLYTGTPQENVDAANSGIKLTSRLVKYTMIDWFKDRNKFIDRFFVNTDPRGYALKLNLTREDKQQVPGLYTDFGGYGLIAPEELN